MTAKNCRANNWIHCLFSAVFAQLHLRNCHLKHPELHFRDHIQLFSVFYISNSDSINYSSLLPWIFTMPTSKGLAVNVKFLTLTMKWFCWWQSWKFDNLEHPRQTYEVQPFKSLVRLSRTTSLRSNYQMIGLNYQMISDAFHALIPWR